MAGPQPAALSIQGVEDTADFISAFTGDDRYIVDYLVDEVLAQRPKGTKDFLLHTSILDRITGSLFEQALLPRPAVDFCQSGPSGGYPEWSSLIWSIFQSAIWS